MFSIYLYFGVKYKKKIYISRKALVLMVFINLLTLLLSLYSGIHIPYYIKMTAMMFYVLLLCSLLSSEIISFENVIKCIKYTIWVNAFFFLFQFSMYQFSGHFIDFNEIVREEYAHTIYNSKSLESFILNIRATGLYSEPSFYSMSVFPAALIISLYEKRVNKTLLLSFFTCLLSLSIAAIIIALVSLLVFYKELKRNKVVLGLITVFLIFSLPFMYEFIISRLFENADYDAIGSRLLIINEFSIRPAYQDFFGSGYFWDENAPIGVTGLNGAQIRDSSFFLYTYFSGGVVGCLILFYIITFHSVKGWKVKYAFCCALLYKLGMFVAVFWFLVALMLLLKSNESKLCKGAGCEGG